MATQTTPPKEEPPPPSSFDKKKWHEECHMHAGNPKYAGTKVVFGSREKRPR